MLSRFDLNTCRSVTRSYFRRADGVMLLYDITSEKSFLSVREWIDAVDVSALIMKFHHLKPIKWHMSVGCILFKLLFAPTTQALVFWRTFFALFDNRMWPNPGSPSCCVGTRVTWDQNMSPRDRNPSLSKKGRLWLRSMRFQKILIMPEIQISLKTCGMSLKETLISGHICWDICKRWRQCDWSTCSTCKVIHN